MKKKILATLLCASMVATMFAGCGSSDDVDTQTANDDTQQTEQESEEEEEPAGPTLADPEDLPETAFAHLTFDGEDEGYTAIVQTDDVGENDGATFGLAPTDVTFDYQAGAVGNAIYLDGSYGLNLNLSATNTDAYTVSFWVNADRLSTFGPTLQMGYDVGKAAKAGNNVTWLNVTQSEWGTDSAKIFPIVWSRNEASNSADDTIDCFPWMYAFDDQIHGKGEWAMVTIVCSGEELTAPSGAAALAGAQYYINGCLVYDSAANSKDASYFDMTWDAALAPNIMQPGDKTFESYFGINYWDTVFKGYVDDLYVYDQALTAGQVASLFLLGDASSSTGTAEEETTREPVTVTGTAVGATDCTSGFWSEFSEIFAVASGESKTVNFKNYTSGENNWNNFVVVLQSTADGHSADDNAAYKEYAVVRADNYGWAGDLNTATEGALPWTVESDWNWDTFKADLEGADVALTVTNNGSTADIVAVVTAADGTVHNQSYKGIAVDGDLYFTLTVDGCCLDIQ